MPASLVCNFIQKGAVKDGFYLFFIPGLMENVSLGMLGFFPSGRNPASCQLCCRACAGSGLGGCECVILGFWGLFVDCLSAMRSFAPQGDGFGT